MSLQRLKKLFVGSPQQSEHSPSDVPSVRPTSARPRGRSEDERRLTGDYILPGDAKPISLPVPRDNDDDDDWKPTMHKKDYGRRGGFRPTNTLDQPSREAARPQQATSYGREPKKLARESKYGGYVYPVIPRAGVNNGTLVPDELENARESKRRKVELDRRSAARQSILIDVDDSEDNDDLGVTVGKSRKPIPLNRGVYTKTSTKRQRDLFGAEELRNVGKLTDLQAGKKRRKSRGGLNSCRGSISDTRSVVECDAPCPMPSRTPSDRKPAENFFTIYDIKTLFPEPEPRRTGTYTPNFEMDKFGDDRFPPSLRRRQNSVSETPSPFLSRGRPATQNLSEAMQPSTSRIQNERRTIVQVQDDEDFDLDIVQHRTRHVSPRPSQMFKRHVKNPMPQKSPKKQALSDADVRLVRTSPEIQSVGSADELEGEGTRSKRPARSASPRPGVMSLSKHTNKSHRIRTPSPYQDARNASRKLIQHPKSSGKRQSLEQERFVDDENIIAIPAHTDEGKDTAAETGNVLLGKKLGSSDTPSVVVDPSRSPAQSDLKTTTFRGLKCSVEDTNLPQIKMTSSYGDIGCDEIANSEDELPINLPKPRTGRDRFDVKAIYCCVCITTPAQLVWRDALDAFFIHHEDEFVHLPESTDNVKIGRHEIHSWSWAPTTENIPLAYIKGSRTKNSSGQILIEFATHQDMVDCHEKIISMLHRPPENVSPGKMSRIAVSVSNALLEITGKATRSGLSNATHREQLASQKRRDRLEESPEPEEERIRYEPEYSPPPKPSVRSRMQMGPTAPEALEPLSGRRLRAGPTTSPFFNEPRKSFRQARTYQRSPHQTEVVPGWTVVNKPKPWKKPVTYPLEGKDRVTVDFADLERLDEGNFLNDNLIAFAIRQIQDQMTAENRKKVYFFNSFFYSGLISKGYDSVKRWTKNIDIFDHQYLIVPINASFHWYVAIICNLPNLPRTPTILPHDSNNSVEEAGAIGNRLEPNAIEIDDSQDRIEVVDGSEEISTSQELPIIDLGDDEGEDIRPRPQPVVARNRKGKKSQPPRPRGYDPDTTAIIMLDSFGIARNGDIRNLKEYLREEACDKRGMKLDTKDLQGMNAKGIPEQSNQSDCGVYVIGYINEFAKDPRNFVTRVLTRQMDKQGDFASFDPSAKRVEIRDELLKLAEA